MPDYGTWLHSSPAYLGAVAAGVPVAGAGDAGAVFVGFGHAGDAGAEVERVELVGAVDGYAVESGVGEPDGSLLRVSCAVLF